MKRIIKVLATLYFFGFLMVLAYVFGWLRYDHVSPELTIKNDYVIVFSDPILEATIYFISSDGEVSQPYSVSVKDPNDYFYGNWPVQMFTWSLDGEYLAFRSKPHSPSGVPVILTSLGEFIKCKGLDLPVASERVWVIDGLKVISPDQSGELDKVVIYNFDTCEIQSILYEATSPNEILQEATLSSDGWIAISRYFKNDRKDILLLDTRDNQYIIRGGENPSWSSDGEKLAFIIDGEGLFVINKNGEDIKLINNNQKISTDTFPSWSPEGDWIIYEIGVNIFKTSVITKETELVVENGIAPNWRWGKP